MRGVLFEERETRRVCARGGVRISSSVMASKHYAPSMLREVSNTANTNGETTARKSTRRAGGGGGGTAEQNQQQQQQQYHQSSMMPADATTRDNANTSEKRWQVRRKLFQRKKSRRFESRLSSARSNFFMRLARTLAIVSHSCHATKRPTLDF